MKKEIIEYIHQVLLILSKRIPTKCNHNFSLITNKEHNLKNQLCLWIRVEEKNVFQSILFDDKYDNETPSELVEEIINNLILDGYDKSYFN